MRSVPNAFTVVNRDLGPPTAPAKTLAGAKHRARTPTEMVKNSLFNIVVFLVCLKFGSAFAASLPSARGADKWGQNFSCETGKGNADELYLLLHRRDSISAESGSWARIPNGRLPRAHLATPLAAHLFGSGARLPRVYPVLTAACRSGEPFQHWRNLPPGAGGRQVDRKWWLPGRC